MEVITQFSWTALQWFRIQHSKLAQKYSWKFNRKQRLSSLIFIDNLFHVNPRLPQSFGQGVLILDFIVVMGPTKQSHLFLLLDTESFRPDIQRRGLLSDRLFSRRMHWVDHSKLHVVETMGTRRVVFPFFEMPIATIFSVMHF